MRKLSLLIAIGAIVLAGCRLDARVGLTVIEDGSGTAVIEVGFDDELLQIAEGFGAFDINQVVSALGVADSNGQVDERREGDMTIYSTSTDFTSVSDLEDIIASFGDIDVGNIDLQVDEDGTVFSGRLDPPEISATLGGVGLIDPTQLEENVSFNLDLLLPGEVGEHNADRTLPDGSLRWAINLDGPTEMNAVSGFGGGGIPTWLIAVIAAAAVAVGGFLALGRNRDGGASSALAAADVPEPPKSFDDV